MKVVVYNLGCKVNQYECDSLVKKLRNSGHDVSSKLAQADIYILNTCAVTNEAERKSRQFVGKCSKLNPNAKIYVCGCASQNNPDNFALKEQVECVGGTVNKMSFCDFENKKGVCVEQLTTVYEDDFSPTVDRTRAYVKIQDGCNNFCSYCLIPYVRGRSRSRDVNSIVAECNELSQLTKEIVLTGIDMSSYGKDCFSSLAKLIVCLKDIDCRIRLGSLEVGVIDKAFLDATMSLKNFCPQFHLSLQSGDDQVLKKMNRHYTTNQYYEKLELIKSYYPNAGITTDLICGFPTENQQTFENTLAFLDKCEFLQTHIFAYSRRGGTVADKLQQLDKTEIKRRVKQAEQVAANCRNRCLEKYLGKPLEVLVEDKEGDFYVGYSKEYIKVLLSDGISGSVVTAVADKIVGQDIFGVIK